MLVPQLVSKALSWFKPDPKQPRKHFPEIPLRALGESLKVRQNDPVQAKPDGTLIDGERRWRAAVLVGLEKLDVIVTDAALTDTQVHVVRLTSFFHREDLSAFEKWLACAELMCGNPSWRMQDLSEALQIDPSMATRLLSPSKLVPEWQDALKAGTVGISDCYAASKLTDEVAQRQLLALKLAGASRDQLEQAGRRQRTATPAAPVKVGRLRCVLPSGFQVVVSGDGVSLESSIDALNDAVKEMRRAKDLGYTAKTFAACMKDKANKS
jgi:ParB/RepB/Spo0J family partition protein